MLAVLDSGAEETVAPKGTFEFPIVESPMQRAGRGDRAANGAWIPNQGQQEVHFLNGKTKCSLKFQVAPVERPLISVSQLAATGQRCVFEPTGGYIEHVKHKFRLPLVKVGGVYVLKLRVKENNGGAVAPAATKPVFRRHE